MVWIESMLAVVCTFQKDALFGSESAIIRSRYIGITHILLDGCVVGPSDHGQTNLVTTMQDEGVEGANAAIQLDSSPGRELEETAYAPSP